VNTPYDRVADAYVEAIEYYDSEVWRMFYHDAHGVARELARQYDEPIGNVCDLIAAISPLKSWPENLRLARIAVEAYRAQDDFDLSTVKLMHNRRLAAVTALRGHGPGGGRKVQAFAANLRGDLTRVTIDRHMLTLCGFGASQARAAWEQCVDAVNQVAVQYAKYPAVVQATVWGLERFRKGHKTTSGKGEIA
jgi:hypothetical protein